MGRPISTRRLNIAAYARGLIAAGTWEPMESIGRRFGVTRPAVYQMLSGEGLSLPKRPVKPRRPSNPQEPAFTGPCADCGRTDNPVGYTRGRCRNACYPRWLYATSEKRRADSRRHTATWVAANPQRAAEIQRRAERAYLQRQRAKRLGVEAGWEGPR